MYWKFRIIDINYANAIVCLLIVQETRLFRSFAHQQVSLNDSNFGCTTFFAFLLYLHDCLYFPLNGSNEKNWISRCLNFQFSSPILPCLLLKLLSGVIRHKKMKWSDLHTVKTQTLFGRANALVLILVHL